MTILVTADTHWTSNPRDSYRHNFPKWLAEQAHKLKARAIIILGDLTEQKDEHGAWLVNKVVEHIYSWTFVCPVVIVRGNHDGPRADNPFWSFLGKFDRVHWVQNPTDLAHVDWGECLDQLGEALLLPSTNNYKRDWEKFKLSKYDFILTHNTFERSDMGQGPLSRGIPLDIFTNDQVVLSGDIHIPQDVGPVKYVGAPYTVDFGDDYDPRILMISGTRAGVGFVLTSMEVSGPQKRLVTLMDIAELKKRVPDIVRGDILKVRVALAADERVKWPEMQDQVRVWGEKQGYIVHAVIPFMLKDTETLSKSKSRRSRQKPDGEIVSSFAKLSNVDEATEKAGLRLMEKSK